MDLGVCNPDKGRRLGNNKYYKPMAITDDFFSLLRTGCGRIADVKAGAEDNQKKSLFQLIRNCHFVPEKSIPNLILNLAILDVFFLDDSKFNRHREKSILLS